MIALMLLVALPSALLVLADLPVWPVDPQPRRDYGVYYNVHTPNVRWDLDGRMS